MIELKHYFVKDASSHDVAIRFDHLKQSLRTVMELKKELECLSQQMIEIPSDYDMACHFVWVLNSDIASTIVKLGINLENSSIDSIVDAAKSVEQSMFYKEQQWRDRM
ncbi:hypothetical protein APHAL10511_002346 [Amanita phalloides]|nr:hypothetical protein APHAL10511_002346 [Amanita phalloides]